jgi:hypothetical protein
MFLDDAPTTVTASCCPNINAMFLFRSLKLANLQQGGVGSHKDACHILGHKIVSDLHVLFCAGGSTNSPFVFSLSCFLASCTQSRSNVRALSDGKVLPVQSSVKRVLIHGRRPRGLAHCRKQLQLACVGASGSAGLTRQFHEVHHDGFAGLMIPMDLLSMCCHLRTCCIDPGSSEDHHDGFTGMMIPMDLIVMSPQQ